MARKQDLPLQRNPANAARLPEGAYVDPRVQSLAARQYAEAAAGRRNPQPLAKYQEPVSGGPTPPVPRLDGDPQFGHTMAEHAEAERPRQPVRQPGIVEGELPLPLAPGLMAGGVGSMSQSGLLSSDLLPPEAQQDPGFRQGVGAMYAQNQPELAKKYGVMRKGQLVPPQRVFGQPAPLGQGPRPQVNPQTLAGLQALEAANRDGAGAPPGPDPAQQARQQRADREVLEADGPLGKSEEVQGGTKPKLTEDEKKEILDQMDEFDFNRFKSAVMKDMLNNDEQRKLIEDRLKPLDVVDLVMRGKVTQMVPVLPGKFEPEFQSHSGEEDLTLKRWLVQEAKSINASDRYFMDKYALMGLTIAVKAVNKRQLPDCYDVDGNLDEKMFWEKFKLVSRFNYHMLSSLFTNWFWFDVRVRKLFVAEELGNG